MILPGNWYKGIYSGKTITNLYNAHQTMRELCKICQKYSTCTKPCEALLRETRKNDEWNYREIPVKNFDLSSEDEGMGTSIVKELYRERQVYTPSDSQTGGLGDDTFAPALEISGDKLQRLKKIIDRAIPPDAQKQRSRFYAFIQCKPMVAIAKQANTSKQNIYKQFERTIKRLNQILHQDRSWKAEKITPYQFKSTFQVVKYD